MTPDEIKKITNYEASKIIRRGRPAGRFYAVTTGNGIGKETTGKTFIGIDNDDGEAFTEEFEYEEEVLAWLTLKEFTAEEIRAGAHKKYGIEPNKLTISIDLESGVIEINDPRFTLK